MQNSCSLACFSSLPPSLSLCASFAKLISSLAFRTWNLDYLMSGNDGATRESLSNLRRAGSRNWNHSLNPWEFLKSRGEAPIRDYTRLIMVLKTRREPTVQPIGRFPFRARIKWADNGFAFPHTCVLSLIVKLTARAFHTGSKRSVKNICIRIPHICIRCKHNVLSEPCNRNTGSGPVRLNNSFFFSPDARAPVAVVTVDLVNTETAKRWMLWK